MRLRLAVFSALVWLACDFDAAYSERCDAGLCGGQAGGSVAGGSAGGSVAGGAVAGGSVAGGAVAGGSAAGGSVAGGSVAGGSAVDAGAADAAIADAGNEDAGNGDAGNGDAGIGDAGIGDAGAFDAGSAVDAGCTLSVRLPVAPAPDCVPVELAYLCAGSPTAASVSLQSSYVSMPTVGGGTFFASPNCTGSTVPSVVSPANISFRPALANNRPLVGEWMLTASTNGLSVPTQLVLQAEVRALATRLQVGVCTPLATPTLTGLMTATPVAFWRDLQFDGFTLPSMFTFCGPSAVTIPAGTASPTVPRLLPSRPYLGSYTMTGMEQVPSLGISATFDITTCMADGGAVSASAECCGGFVFLSDGGIACP